MGQEQTTTDPADPVNVFVQEIRKERDQGYGFVPLIGSGVSALSSGGTHQNWQPALSGLGYLAYRGVVFRPREGSRGEFFGRDAVRPWMVQF